MIYNGSCHCGQIKFQVEGEIKQLMSCNCSICSRKGSLLWFAPREKFRLLTRQQRLGTYTFNKHVIKHHFCPTCGMHPFAESVDRSGKPTAAINARCLENFDFTAVPAKPFDGRSL
jgi:hypothetical protein